MEPRTELRLEIILLIPSFISFVKSFIGFLKILTAFRYDPRIKQLIGRRDLRRRIYIVQN